MDAAAASTVRIAVNDISAGQHVLFASIDDDLLVPLRAVRSLSRLDSVLRAEKHAADDAGACDTLAAACHLAYKCPSFPRIDRYSSVDEMRLTLDADSMSPRLSNATLSQDLDGELLALSISNLCVPVERMSSRRHDATLTRSVSARTVALAPNVVALAPNVAATVNNLLSPPSGLAVTTTTTLPCRSLTRSASCPSLSLPLHLSPSLSSLLQPRPATSSTQRGAGRLPGNTAATSTKAGKGRAQFDSDVDLETERVTDLPVIATSDFPDFLYETSTGVEMSPALPVGGAQLTVAALRSRSTSSRYDADVRLLAQLGSYRQRAPQLAQIKCLRWLSSLDHGAL